MSSREKQRQWVEKDAQALLSVFKIQPPEDFAAQVLARVETLQTVPAPKPVPSPSPRPLAFGHWLQGFGQAWRYAWLYAWRPRRVLVYTLLATSTVGLSAVLKHVSVPAASGDTAMTAAAAPVPGLTTRQNAVPAPVALPPAISGPWRGEESQWLYHIVPQAGGAGSLGPVMASNLSALSQEALQTSPRAQQPERQRPSRSKGKRSGKSARLHKG